jgi:carbonic anhydrase
MKDDRLIALNAVSDLPDRYRGTPIERLVEYQNFDRPFEAYSRAEILIGMCMDSRKHLHIPENFAFILRTGGANLRYSEFKISYAIAVGGVKAIALMGHNNCGMVNLVARRDQFIAGLVETAGWPRQQAEEHFMNYAPMFEIEDEVRFLLLESRRLREKYPKILIAPFLYKLEDGRLYQIRED